MTVVFSAATLIVHLGDCLDVLPGLPVGNVHAVVTDPPYGLEFMSRDWDAPWRTGNGFRRRRNHADAGRDSPFGRASPTSPEYAAGPGYQAWCTAWAAGATALRVLKPGGHLLAFGGPRTWHRLACGIEGAGFEIRDSIDWIYAQGFPKSLNVAKAIDKAARGTPQGNADPASPGHGRYKTQATEGRRGPGDTGQGYSAGPGQFMDAPASAPLDEPRTDQARRWNGWGTGLKPAARADPAGPQAAGRNGRRQRHRHQAGALHIDACRTGNRQPHSYTTARWNPGATINRDGTWKQSGPGAAAVTAMLPAGRWPTNIVFSHAPGCDEDTGCQPGCPVADLAAQAGTRHSGARPGQAA